MSRSQEARAQAHRMPPDETAVIRTALANERTLLAYVRTALAFAAAGAAVIHFLDSRAASVAGGVLAGAGLVLLGVGAGRFLSTGKSIRASSGGGRPPVGG